MKVFCAVAERRSFSKAGEVLGLTQPTVSFQVSSLEEVDELGAELEDRFGPLPLQGKNLLYMVRIKLMGSRIGLQEISSERGQVVIKLGPDVRIDRPTMQAYFGDRLRVGTSQLRLDTKRVGREWRKVLEGVLERMAQTTDGSQSHSDYESGGSR